MNVINDDVQYITHSILDLRHLKGFAGWNEWGDHMLQFSASGRKDPLDVKHQLSNTI
ncbi:hypothetical protein DPMN_047018 [Dreissena polymorpha]|uniref:Uncharacterized protein n=1 Tax=Dreissena polymorpha TaxID=45954 RepID=A0A9D4I062_DREPO|nr:hypothetical protein DPMN_044019 [Dreissena polymorpha]KAH3740315.1 hypothetical protein DPMN_047018 [Dreissena polymorpha]